MSAAADTLPNPFEAAKAALIARLNKLAAPSASAIGDAADHIRDAANIFDEWLYAVGSQVADRSFNDVDMRSFQGAFLGAVDGNATYEVEVACEPVRRSLMRRAS